MSLTKINCFSYTQGLSQTDNAVLLNPLKKPGSFLMAVSSPATNSLGAKVATQLALNHFVEGVLGFCEKIENLKSKTLSHDVVSAGFKNANRSVYDFGHKLVAGGRMKAFLTTLAVVNGVVSVAKVGCGDVYLYRNKHIYSFFAEEQMIDVANVGQNAKVSVEFSDIDLEPEDKLILFSKKLNTKEFEICQRFINRVEDFNQALLSKMIFKVEEYGTKFSSVMMAEVKENTILLDNVYKENDEISPSLISKDEMQNNTTKKAS